MAASERMEALFDQEKYQVEAAYGNMVYREKLSRAEAREFLDIYRQDFAQANFTGLRENVPTGMLMFTVSEELPSSYGGMARSTRSWEMNLGIYPFYKESIDWLKERGYYRDSQVSLEDVARIQVLNRNNEISQKLFKEQQSREGTEEFKADIYSADTYMDTRVYADYTQQEELEKIAACIYPQDMIVSDWDCGRELDSDYEVLVYFKTDNEITRDYGTYAYYGFLEGEVPDFVRVDTAYKE